MKKTPQSKPLGLYQQSCTAIISTGNTIPIKPVIPVPPKSTHSKTELQQQKTIPTRQRLQLLGVKRKAGLFLPGLFLLSNALHPFIESWTLRFGFCFVGFGFFFAYLCLDLLNFILAFRQIVVTHFTDGTGALADRDG